MVLKKLGTIRFTLLSTDPQTAKSTRSMAQIRTVGSRSENRLVRK